jgi:ADP-heptose:LPS heptosyltransferase
MCALWGGDKLCGLRREDEFCPDPDLFPVSEDGEHEVLRFLKLLDCLDIPAKGTHLEFPINNVERTRANKIGEEAGLSAKQYVCLHAGARDPRRRWPVENFSYVARALDAQGYTPVLTGSREEENLLYELEQQIGGPVVNTVDKFGHLTAGELAAIISDAALLVTNDTGVSHVAAALEIPSVIIFSPYSDINRWRPLDEELHVAVSHDRAVDPEYVLKSARELLATMGHVRRKISTSFSTAQLHH